jgi:hypothetical protein
MNMAERAQHLMDVLFPDTPDCWKWHRKTNDGFITIPRTLPIVMQAVDAVSKGQPVGHVLFCLWARSPDHPVIKIEHPATFAGEAGFIGERAVDTWRRRMKRLRELKCISTKPGPSGEFHYVMLLNPNATMEWLRAGQQVQDGIYARFIERALEIGVYGEIEAIREYWKQLQDQQADAKASEAAEAEKNVDESQTTPAEPSAAPRVRRRKNVVT